MANHSRVKISFVWKYYIAFKHIFISIE